MKHVERIEQIRETLLLRRELHAEGVHDRTLRAAAQAGRLVRVARGVYAPADSWSGWNDEERHLARVIALDLSSVRRPLFTRISAAVIHGLPSFRIRGSSVHVLVPKGRSLHSGAGVARHEGDVDEADVVEIGGLLCTGIARTMLDLARWHSPDEAISALDVGLARLFGSEPAAHQEIWKKEGIAELEQLPGHRGVAVARRLIRFADGRAGSPAESLSRLNLARLGYDIDIQVEVPAPVGKYWIDFEFLGLDLFGEVDGAVKYTDPLMLKGRTANQAVIEEKRREDWVRGSTRKGLVRWGFAEGSSTRRLGRHLRGLGVPPPPRRRTCG